MVFHTLGDSSKKSIVFVHGMLTPWQIWEKSAEVFSKNYYVIIPELDAHTEEEKSTFISVEKEAEKIKEYLLENRDGKVFLLAGLSMGGRISATIAKDSRINIENLVLDGAPLLSMPKFAVEIMKKNYMSIIAKIKKRNSKVIENCKKNFIPEKYLESFFKIADNMKDESIVNIMGSVFGKFDFTEYAGKPRILFMHGSRSNESISKKSACKLKEINPQTQINCYEGYAHAELLCFEEQKWIKEIEKWLEA